jgi:O-antigen/teichoic acid export membrane protein
MAIATVVHVTVALLSDVGIQQAVVQNRRGSSPEFQDTAWSLQVMRGWLIWGVCVVVAGTIWLADSWGLAPAGTVYAVPVLPAIVAISSLASAIMGFTSTQMMTANRALNLRKVTLIELTSQITGLSVMFAIGWWTRSIWSVVAGGLLTAVVSVTLSHTWMTGHRNRFRFDSDCVREIVSFGRWIFVSSALGVLATNGDRFLLGLWLPAGLLGVYSIALNLATVIEGLAYRLFGGVSFAVFSEVARETPARLRSVYFRMRLPADLVFLTVAGLLYAVGPSIVNLLYDHRYSQAGPMLQVLSFGLFFTRYSLSCNTYVALGKPQYQTVVQVVNVLSMMVFIPGLYALYGVSGAIWGVALYRLPLAIVVWVLSAREGIHSTLFELAVLPAWAIGWAIGLVFTQLLHH